jgi:uncharacterized membrane protein
MSDPSDAQLNATLAQLPGYYTESDVGKALIGLLYQAIVQMRGDGRSEAEISPMLQQAVKELQRGLEEATFRDININISFH